MPTLTHDGLDLHYTDSGGSGRPVVLIHGWPLSGESWSELSQRLQGDGFRVITYDRRGFGRSTPGPADRYDYDTLTADLDALVAELGLTDLSLVGFSMGGGEVARYAGRTGAPTLHSIVLAAAIPPCLLEDAEHPDGGLDLDTLAGMQAGLRADREGFLTGFLTNFFSAAGKLQVSQDQLDGALGLAAQADLEAAAQCMRSWVTDFTGDLAGVTVPALVVHGDGDAIVPIQVSGQRSHEQLAGSELHVIANGPHGINTSHPAEFNDVVAAFLAR